MHNVYTLCIQDCGIVGLVLVINLFGEGGWEADEFSAVEVGFVHVYCGDLVIVVGSVVTDTLVEIVTSRVDSIFILIISKVAAAVLLVDRV